METYPSLFRALTFFFSRILHKHLNTPRYLQKQVSNVLNNNNNSLLNLQYYPPFLQDDHQTVVFNVEQTLLRSSSLFPYFMLVAFEAGTPFRALILFFLYPFICLFPKQLCLKLMVMICFFGIRKDRFMVGKSVLPKFLLEDVGFEGFEMIKKFKRKVGVSEMPQVMIQSFLKQYLEVDYVVGKELKVFCGYFIGLMEDNAKDVIHVNDNLRAGDLLEDDVAGISSTIAPLSHPLFAFCKEIFLTNEGMKKNWHDLPKASYPKPLIFHDGRLALKPTPLATLALFMWLPFGVILALFRALLALSLPLDVSRPILAFTGMQLSSNNNQQRQQQQQPIQVNPRSGKLYACNHRTLLDPLYISYAINKPLTAVTYSLSRISEILAPIRTVRLRRDRNQDGMMMEKLLNQGDLVVCPEGTTCREPFLLRFSPLFAEMSEAIIPVALNCHVTMFYGTTAGGFKCLDPLFFLMNPTPSYTVRLLDPIKGLSTCQDQRRSRFDVANQVQKEIGEALGFESTKLTRKDKYLILAGNHGVV